MPSDSSQIIESACFDRHVVGFRNASFTWNASEKGNMTPTASRRVFRLLIEDELKFKHGRLNLVLGPTGSGKTSLLMALLGRCTLLSRD